MSTEHYIAIAGVIATLIGIVATWLVAKRSNKTKRLSYRLAIEPLFKKQIKDTEGELQITYKGELVPEPVLLTIDVTNTGNQSIKNPPIEIEATGATYIIPGYFENVPPGYEDLWSLERTEAESCAIRVEHINPGQVIRARFLLDELPSALPIFKCPMADVEVKQWEKIEIGKALEIILKIYSPMLARSIQTIIK